MNPETLILASRSSRRAKLLSEAGYQFIQVAPGFQDPPEPCQITGTPESLAIDLAITKARSTFNIKDLDITPQSWILAADTIVVDPEGLLRGQPQNRSDAKRTLQSLINKTHCVYTGVTILDHPGGRLIQAFADDTQVHLGHVTQANLSTYLDSGQWRGKAGGYNLFDLPADWPWFVTGDPTTVVGLPMKKLKPHLERYSSRQKAGCRTTTGP